MSVDESLSNGLKPKGQSPTDECQMGQQVPSEAGKQQSVIAESRGQQLSSAPQRIRQSVIAESDVEFFEGIAKIVEGAKTQVERAVNTVMCMTYYEVGRLIVEQEQAGARRATYGIKLLEDLSSYLTTRCGRGWLVRNLRNARQFYLLYSPEIRQSLTSESGTVNP